MKTALIALGLVLSVSALNHFTGADVDELPGFVYVYAPNDRPVCPTGYTSPEYAAAGQYRCTLDTRLKGGR